MAIVYEHLNHYACGKKGHTHRATHGEVKENKNVTNVQKLLSDYDITQKQRNKV